MQFDNVVMKYAPDLSPALNGVSFATSGQEKVGIVGRTGGGKSSLGVALFRIVNVFSGDIRIDGVSIAQIPLEELRLRIAVIPQVSTPGPA